MLANHTGGLVSIPGWRFEITVSARTPWLNDRSVLLTSQTGKPTPKNQTATKIRQKHANCGWRNEQKYCWYIGEWSWHPYLNIGFTSIDVESWSFNLKHRWFPDTIRSLLHKRRFKRLRVSMRPFGIDNIFKYVPLQYKITPLQFAVKIVFARNPKLDHFIT